MALSNWDTLAVDQTGAASTGVFTSPLGIVLEIYKNWIYVRDEHAWESGGDYTRPTVMEIDQGNIVYKDVHILAVRGPQNGVYVVVWSWSGPGYEIATAMVGCGVSGYTDDGTWVGVTEESRNWWQAQLTGSHPIWSGFDVIHSKFCEHSTETEAAACPVAEHARDEEYVFQGDFPEELRKINLASASRFNQGDAFFARHLHKPVPSTPVGAADQPVLTSVCEAFNKPTDPT